MDSERLSILLCLLLILYFASSSVDAYKFRVGGKDGWSLKPSGNYSHWAGRLRFQVNDTLSFKYKKESDSVIVVSKDDYEKCNTAKPIIKFENGDSDFKFDRSGPFYFITGNKSNCDQGQKLVIVVLAIRNYPLKPPLAPAPATHTPSGAPTPSLTHVPSPASHSPVPSPASYTPVPSPVSQTPVPSPASYTPVPSPASYTPVPSPASYTPVRSPASQTPVPSPASYTPVPSPASQTPVSSPASYTPVPSPASYTPVPSPVSQAPEPSPVTYTPVPSPDSQAPVPYPAPLEPSPSSESPVRSPAPANTPGVTSSVVMVSLLLSVALGGFVTSY